MCAYKKQVAFESIQIKKFMGKQYTMGEYLTHVQSLSKDNTKYVNMSLADNRSDFSLEIITLLSPLIVYFVVNC